MTIRVAISHRTNYRYDRSVKLTPQLIRLRPAAHCRTPIVRYSLKVGPDEHFENWQQDPHGNFLLRCVFPEVTRELDIDVELIADLTVINPFDFFVEPYAEQWPFQYEDWLRRDLQPYLEHETPGPEVSAWLASVDRSKRRSVDFATQLNQRLESEIDYLVRLEPGVQTCEETLTKRSGSCRDSAWLLVQLMRNLGIAARFASGYLIQLVPDVKPLDGPGGTDVDFTDLHAWAEIYLPGAGWIGLDPTSGLLAGEGHVPLACTPEPSSAAPITGGVEECETEFGFEMNVTRVHEDPRVTKPYTDAQWRQVNAIGHEVDERLRQGDVRLTMGGEPTFVSVDDMEGAEWTTAAVGPTKRRMAEELLGRLQNQIAPKSLLHYGQGKWYPGEPLPRWALTCMWRDDGEPIWKQPELVAQEGKDYGHEEVDALRFVSRLADRLELDADYVFPVYEDVAGFVGQERQLPINVDARDNRLKSPEDRARLARIAERGVGRETGYVLPVRRQWWQAKPRWVSSRWPIRSDYMFLLPGDSPIGLRLPLDSLPWFPKRDYPDFNVADPSVPRGPLSVRVPVGAANQPGRVQQAAQSEFQVTSDSDGQAENVQEQRVEDLDDRGIVPTALCVEPRNGRLYVFMPPTERLEDYLELVEQVEATAAQLSCPVILEGYLPPADPRLNLLKVTPDPGVIEVNTHPSKSWSELVESTELLYEEARQSRLGTEKFDLDGRHTGTGGGNHIVLGGPTPLDSPFLRRPDLLKSLIGYWNNHPCLSYLFSSTFIGPTSQAPRVDEGRRDAIYELDIAFKQISDSKSETVQPWLVDRLFRNLLVDLTGNTHRAEICIDKLYSPDSSTGRLGLVEFRAFEMPPHARMSLTQQLLLRSLVARFWDAPYTQRLVDWGTTLHDKYLLPHFLWSDLRDVIAETRRSGFQVELDWFAPHFEFRFPFIGTLGHDSITLDLRQAIEPWYVLGEEPGEGGTTRFVDSSLERIEVKVKGLNLERFYVTCNHRRLPLHPTGIEEEYVAAVRYRAWQPPSCLHPTIPVHVPLVFELFDCWSGRTVSGCTYHVSHPAGRNYEAFPVNAYEAEARRAARFFANGHTAEPFAEPPVESINPRYPLTLDLRQ